MPGGLRLRLAGALLLTSAVTLAVAAALLLSPLEAKLRDDAIASLTRQLRADRTPLAQLGPEELRPRRPALRRTALAFRRRSGGEIAIVDARGRVLTATDADARSARFPIAARALASGRTETQVTGSGAQATVRVSVPVAADDGTRVAIVGVLRVDEPAGAVAVVKRAFVSAAGISLLITLALGLVLAGRLARRLRALRDTALRVAELGPVVEMRADDTRDEVGDLTRALVTMQDRLRDQEQARRAFVATASHELRTPLASLRVMLDLLRDDLTGETPDVADARQQAERAEVQAERLTGLAADLLDLSRLDAGGPVRRDAVDLVDLTRSVLAEFEVRTRDSGHTLTHDADSDAVWAIGDPGSIAQIVRILVDNALRHGPSQGTVGVAVSAPPEGATILVTDSGGPIPPAERSRIFARFERGSSATATPGFGLGLAIGRELAARMDGTLDLDDATDAGSGTRFRLTLPAAPAGERA